jgi:hypothetical protein
MRHKILPRLSFLCCLVSRSIRLLVCVGSLCYLAAPTITRAQTITLRSSKFEIAINPADGKLISLTNKITGEDKSIGDTPFSIATDSGTADSGRARLSSSEHDATSASFEYVQSGLTIIVRYRVPANDSSFFEKSLSVTNHTQSEVVLDAITLERLELTPAPVFVHFHRAGFPASGVNPDSPINLFLRYKKGGIFMGIENPYFGLIESGRVLSLEFQPRWVLSPGETFTSDPAFLGVYRFAGLYAMKTSQPHASGETSSNGEQEVLDWGEIWAMQDFMRRVLTSTRPPGPGYFVGYNACGGMEYLWRLREAKAKTPAQQILVHHFAGSNEWGKEIVHGAFRPSWVTSYQILIDHLASIGHVRLLQPGTLWLGNAGFWDQNNTFFNQLKADKQVPANASWVRTWQYARSKAVDLYGFECPASNYFPEQPEWKYVSRDGRKTGWNCYANAPFVNWHRQALDDAITRYDLPWWQWDEGWADVNDGQCYATNHSHLPGDVSYQVYRGIQGTTAYLKKRHPLLYLTGISVFQHDVPWILRTVDESVTYGDPWYAHNYLFLPPGKSYIGDLLPQTENLEYSLLHHLSLADHFYLGQPLWYADARRSQRAQAFWNDWLNWADAHLDYLRVRQDLFGQPSGKTLEGSAHIIRDRGFLFLFNPTAASRTGSIPLNSTIGLSGRQNCQVRELYPVHRIYGVYSKTLLATLGPHDALVLELESTTGSASKTILKTPAHVDNAFPDLQDLARHTTAHDLWPLP